MFGQIEDSVLSADFVTISVSAVSLQSTYSLHFLQTWFFQCQVSAFVQVSITGLSQFGLPVLCRVLWFCRFVVFLSVFSRFPKFLWIVSVSLWVSHFPHRLATVFVCLTFLAVSFQDFGKAWQVAVQIFCAVHKPASGSKNCRDFCQVLEGPPELACHGGGAAKCRNPENESLFSAAICTACACSFLLWCAFTNQHSFDDEKNCLQVLVC